MKVQGINSNYTNYNDQQSKKAKNNNLSFGIIKLGEETKEVVANAIIKNHSDMKAAMILKKALGEITCNLKEVFLLYQCSTPGVHSKFAESANKLIFSHLKNPENIEISLCLNDKPHDWGDDIRESYSTPPWSDNCKNTDWRGQYYGAGTYVTSDELINLGCPINKYIGGYGLFDCDYIRGFKKDNRYDLGHDIIYNELLRGSYSVERSSSGWKHYQTDYKYHDIVAQLAELLPEIGNKCYLAMRTVSDNFNRYLHWHFPEEQQDEASVKYHTKEDIIKMLS